MSLFNIFLLLGIGALIFSFFTPSKSIIWGDATLGLIVGIVLGIIKGDFSDILRAALIGADFGLIANTLGMIGDHMKRHSY